ncbi:hypothetical protein Dsin_024473 [Dipteronia sinensis]|uniref:DUF4283 domain-containing protein n=1 Tax=Dipteronia sinensis TaxID=43782 RepID=A0AAD9ZVE2_9ROSI|nr:hypothetical protein Dsin_024473 [Dipteronia sinensis]
MCSHGWNLVQQLYRVWVLVDLCLSSKLEDDFQLEGLGDVSRCLVGKVLTGKKVNRDVFIGLIEQLWSLIGRVRIKSVGDNTFMFFFRSLEDRNQIWNRCPWQFDKSLIFLGKPIGSGDISKIAFDQVGIWVQIHNIPIMCMNRRTARRLADQIGVVIEIPTDSKECWGRFIRVKIQVDILKSLKRWLRLKLDRSENITVVSLKYERLLEFHYACKKIGHGLREYPDDDARTNALEGSIPKYGA